MEPIKAKYRLWRITNKYLILEIIFCSYFRQRGFAYLLQTSKSFRQLLRENFKAALSMSENALEHLKALPCTISKLFMPGTAGEIVCVVLLNGDRLYTEADKILYVYSISDLTRPIKIYDLPAHCLQGFIDDNRLFLRGDSSKMIVYEI